MGNVGAILQGLAPSIAFVPNKDNVMFDHEKAFQLLHCGFEIQPAPSLEEVPEDVQILHVTRKTLALDRLPRFPDLRFLNAHDIDDSQFHYICAASQITYLGANIFGITALHPLRNLVNLLGLELTDNSKVTSLNGLEKLDKLQMLVLDNCPITIDLSPLSACNALRYLWLSSRYEKAMRIDSLAPLSDLAQLERLKFKNVRVEDRRLTALHKLTNLVEIELPNFFPPKEFLALADALPNASGQWLDSHKKSKQGSNPE